MVHRQGDLRRQHTCHAEHKCPTTAKSFPDSRRFERPSPSVPHVFCIPYSTDPDCFNLILPQDSSRLYHFHIRCSLSTPPPPCLLIDFAHICMTWLIRGSSLPSALLLVTYIAFIIYHDIIDDPPPLYIRFVSRVFSPYLYLSCMVDLLRACLVVFQYSFVPL